MRKIILMTSAAVIAPMSAIAQTPTCTATPDCASLGYTEASCPNGGVKCPWGDKWACTTSESEFCSKYGFKYTCSGTGYSGGSGTACGGKYTACICASGYKWENGSCVEQPWGKCTGIAAQCSLGDILFSDGTCSANTVSGKTPIAVVVYKSGNCGQAMALYSLGNYTWGKYGADISDLPNLSMEQASQDFASCENSKKIRAQEDSSRYEAVWVAYNYSTEGTKVGDWCLPAGGIFTSIYNNKDAINTGFTRANGAAFRSSSSQAWSSSESYAYDAYKSYISNSYNDAGYGLTTEGKNSFGDQIVRPVIEF